MQVRKMEMHTKEHRGCAEGFIASIPSQEVGLEEDKWFS